MSRLDQLLFWLSLSIFSIPSWSLQLLVRCPVLSTMVPAPSVSLPHCQSPLSVGSFNSRNVRVSCIPTPVWFLSSDSYLLLASVFYFCLPLLGSQLPLLASAVGFLASASDFSFCFPLLGSRLPLLAVGIGLMSSVIGQDQVCLLHSEFWLIAEQSS